MALPGLAASGGFLSAQDVKRYDEELQKAIQSGGPLPGISQFQPQDPYQKIGFISGGPAPAPIPKPAPQQVSKGKGSKTVTPRINSQEIQNQRVGGAPIPEPQNSTNVPEGYTGMWGLDPYQMGQIQTRGGGFTPDGYYSAGYHGSGERPDIAGEATPGVYKSGSFGSIYNPDLSNDVKINDYIRYLGELGYDTSELSVSKLRQQYNENTFNGELTLGLLPNKSEQNKELLKSINPSTPYAEIHSKLGGRDFSTLFRNAQVGSTQPLSALAEASQGAEQARVGGVGKKTTPEPVTSSTYAPTPSSVAGSVGGINSLFEEKNTLFDV